MPWFKVDDGLHCHPKALAAGNAAIGLWTRLGSYASDQLTDGFVPKTIAKSYGTARELAQLVVVNMITPGEHKEYGAGYWLHDYHDYNPTADKVRADRADAAERQRSARERRQNEQRDSQPKSQRESHRESHGQSRSDNSVSHTYPDPTRPVPKEEDLTSSTSFTSEPVDNREIQTEIAAWTERRRA